MKKKSNRQIGDRPKIPKTFRLDADLVDWLETRSRLTNQAQIDIVETALNEYRRLQMTIYAYNVQMKADRYALLNKVVISTNEGIQIGVKPDPNQEYVERRDPETNNILWCNPDDYYEDSEGLLEFLAGEGFEGNPFTETT